MFIVMSNGIKEWNALENCVFLEAACGICGEDFLANHQQEDEIKNDDDNLKHVGCLNITTKELNGDIK